MAYISERCISLQEVNIMMNIFIVFILKICVIVKRRVNENRINRGRQRIISGVAVLEYNSKVNKMKYFNVAAYSSAESLDCLRPVHSKVLKLVF